MTTRDEIIEEARGFANERTDARFYDVMADFALQREAKVIRDVAAELYQLLIGPEPLVQTLPKYIAQLEARAGSKTDA